MAKEKIAWAMGMCVQMYGCDVEKQLNVAKVYIPAEKVN